MASVRRIRVMIVDDHPLVREGLKQYLGRYDDIDVVADAADPEQCLLLLKRVAVDVLLLDISLTEKKTGIGLARELLAGESELRILYLSMHEEDEFVLNALRTGAGGYVLKSAQSEEIVAGVRAVAKGIRYVSPSLTHLLLNEKDRDVITGRETEILRKIVDGMSAKEIAETLGISHRTVETHRNNVMKKLGAKNVAELVKLSIEGGYV